MARSRGSKEVEAMGSGKGPDHAGHWGHNRTSLTLDWELFIFKSVTLGLGEKG